MHALQPSLEARHLSPADMARWPGFVAWSGNPNPTTRLQQFAKAIMVILPVLACIFVGLRIIMVPMTVSSYMFAKTTYIGVHIRYIPPIDAMEARRWDYLSQVFYHPILPLVKTSMLLFLLKLGRQKPGMKHAIHAVNALNLAAMVATTLTATLQCLPVRRYWDPRVRGSCIPSIGRFYISAAAISIFTDVLVLGLPFWVFLDLQMARKLKIAVLAVFCFGSLVTIVSVVRLYYFYRLFSENPLEVQRRLRNPDPSYNIAFVVSNLETSLAIMCACVPALRGLARTWFPGGGSAAAARPACGDRYTLTSLTSWSPLHHALEAGRVSRSRRRVSNTPSRFSLRAAGEGGGGGRRGGPPARNRRDLLQIGEAGHGRRRPDVSETRSLDGASTIVCQTHISVRYERQSKSLSVTDTDSELTMVEGVVRAPPPAKLEEPEDKGMRTCMSSDFDS
ncbi:hypothetical protein GGTG_03862 [Gaeumannomyces tritici R3-111a-1]|uniref:Rhodopsin domain-containing protein n=1 Tax=Gaeumannomyces tritici (strain R3-111a-1) TaxID=644352 RepID=J3NRF8_GAET3|nr:hypothetical protein GGTG_03862 [Gaeumannomyces tritici R3-111a-1]EJT78764.1 hypothetical protein GGTG_03862 [Gaeumannomyces tritici R3-111a-1]